METIIFLLLVIILVVVLLARRNMLENMSDLYRQLQQLSEKIDSLKKQLPTEIASSAKPVIEHKMPPEIEMEPIRPQADQWASGFKRVEEQEEQPDIPPQREEIREPTLTESPVISSQEKLFIPEEPQPGFFERHPDLEKFIGENLVPKIGIAILVIAIGFFVKYAIDQQWIGSIGRVAIGILSGGILVALAHRLRINYRAFSSVLTGGGLAVFYFTIGLAYHQFHLFSQIPAFIIMLVITIFSVVLSLLYDKQEVAVIALVGGFATPFIVSNGEGNYVNLFSYLLVLNTGLLIIAYRKAWRLLNMLAFIFTSILFASWLSTLQDPTPPKTYINALWFASAFYVLFLAINLAHNIRENKRFIASDFSILLTNSALYFSVGLYCLTAAGFENLRGSFSASLAVINLVLSFLLLRKKSVDPNILYLLIGITLTFISITAPVQLKGNNITLFWASEVVLLYWLYQRSNILLIRHASLLISAALIVSLLMDWNNIYQSGSDQKLPVVINKGFITSLFVTLAAFLLHRLRSSESISSEAKQIIPFPNARILGAITILLLFATGALEVEYQFRGTVQQPLLVTVYFNLFVTGLILFLDRQQPTKHLALVKRVLLSLAIFINLLHSVNLEFIQRQLMFDTQTPGYFIVHWISAILVLFLLWKLVESFRKETGLDVNFTVVSWIITVLFIIFLSVDFYLLTNSFIRNEKNWHYVSTQYIKIGLPILWGLCALALMYIGMQQKKRTLRIIALVLFGITLVKLFTYDIQNIAIGGKIAAFFCLGVLLLVISFMYQRLKRLLIDDTVSKE